MCQPITGRRIGIKRLAQKDPAIQFLDPAGRLAKLGFSEDQPANQPTNQQTDQPTNQPTNQPNNTLSY